MIKLSPQNEGFSKLKQNKWELLEIEKKYIFHKLYCFLFSVQILVFKRRYNKNLNNTLD